MSVLFISGIDTDIGKTYATGQLAKALLEQGCQIITQKIVQTGCQDIAEDIITHRKLMDIPLQTVDNDGTTCPYVFTKPASPHLSSQLENTTIDVSVITKATKKLAANYDLVLLEGAGGLMVPITPSLLTIDYIAQQGYPIVLVTSGRLGSINHTLLSIEAIQAHSLKLHAVLYNHWQPNAHLQSNYPADTVIKNSTKNYLQNYLAHNFPATHWIDLPNISSANNKIEKDALNRYALNNDEDTSQTINQQNSLAYYASILRQNL